MDIKKFDSKTNADKGVELILEEKTSSSPGAAILLLGADSAKCKEKDHDIQRRNREKKSPLTPEEIEDQLFERLVEATKDWRGLEEGGKPLAFSKDAAAKLYRDYPEIADKAAGFIFSRSNFFPTASAS